jgi:hypothetical protein
MPQAANPTPTAPVRVTFAPPDGGHSVEVDIDAALTGHAAIRGLVEQTGLAPPSADLGYLLRLKRGSVELPLDRPLLASGVLAGDIISVVRSDIAARRA